MCQGAGKTLKDVESIKPPKVADLLGLVPEPESSIYLYALLCAIFCYITRKNAPSDAPKTIVLGGRNWINFTMRNVALFLWTGKIPATLEVTLRYRMALNTRPRAYAYISSFHLACPARIAAIALALPSGVRAPVDSPP